MQNYYFHMPSLSLIIIELVFPPVFYLELRKSGETRLTALLEAIKFTLILPILTFLGLLLLPYLALVQVLEGVLKIVKKIRSFFMSSRSGDRESAVSPNSEPCVEAFVLDMPKDWGSDPLDFYFEGTWVNTGHLAQCLKGSIPDVVRVHLTGGPGNSSEVLKQATALSALRWLSRNGYDIRELSRLANQQVDGSG